MTLLPSFPAQVLAWGVALTLGLSGWCAPVPVRVERQGNLAGLVLGPVVEPGALFILAAPDLPSLTQCPGVWFQTNTPLPVELRLAFPPEEQGSSQAFLSIVLWPGRSVAQFAHPDYDAEESRSRLEFLQAAFQFGSAPVPPEAVEPLTQLLEDRRLAAIDLDTSWVCPLAAGCSLNVAGVFGEWRGGYGQEAHEGLDLAAPAEATVVASRAGVVSAHGFTSPGGEFLVLDHGDGWFSRYLGLEMGSLVVLEGSVVPRSAPLALRLHSRADAPPHLHFEVRLGSGTSQWGVAKPGTAQDPLRTSTPFSVPIGLVSPEIEEFGLTHQHPGQIPFRKAPPAPAESDGPIYLTVRGVDPEPDGAGGQRRLGLARMSFAGEGLAPLVIEPADADALLALEPPGTAGSMGFACSGGLFAAIPDPLTWYRYWWKWETSGYAGDPRGPRTLVLSGQDYGGATVTNSLSFGPEIRNSRFESVGSRQYRVILVAHLGSADRGAELLQPDQYRLEVFHADGTSMPNVLWQGLAADGVTAVFLTHLEESSYLFEVPEGEDQTTFRVRASSRMVPHLRHEVGAGSGPLPCRCPQAPALVDIPAGTFLMGSPSSEVGRFSWEGPQTLVHLSYSFKMGQYEVTQGEYKALMSNNPSYFSGDARRPVEQVSWTDAMEYCRRLTECERQAQCLPAGWVYRLPTEAEWEYACRAGGSNAFHYGPALRSGMANFDGFYEYEASVGEVYNPSGTHLWKTTAVGGYRPNAWGLHDLHGNVWEWCLDWWSGSLPGGEVTNPTGPVSGVERAFRGGCWYNDGRFCRTAYRLRASPATRGNDLGFRVVLAPAAP